MKVHYMNLKIIFGVYPIVILKDRNEEIEKQISRLFGK
jgi:hypothetical protein